MTVAADINWVATCKTRLHNELASIEVCFRVSHMDYMNFFFFCAQNKKLEKIKDKHLHSIQCCVHGYSREMVHKLANYWCPDKHWKLDIIYSIRLLIQNISLKFSTVARTFVKKPTIATGNRLGWRIASAAGQAKFHSCSTKLPNK